MMASNHVPSEQPPVQGHNLYNDPAYQNLFSSADRYGTPSWETQLHHQSSAPQNWHHGVYAQQPFNAAGQAYAAQPLGLRTASPYQYGQFGQPGAVPNYGQVSNVDPSLGMDPNAVRQQQQSPYPMPMRNITPQGHAGTITPQALQHNVTSQLQRPPVSPFQAPTTVVNQYMPQRTVSQSFVQPVKAPEYELPGVSRKGGFFSRDQSEMAKITNSNPLNKFVLLGNDFFHLPAHRTALPVHNARLSIKDLKKAGKDSRKLKAQLHASKSQMRALKSQKRSAASPADLKREATDSASSDETSDDSSDYTSDEEEEESPLPASRPDDPHAAVRYDIIKSTWYPRSSSPSPDKIKTSMREIWEVLNTIQKRWRADTRAVTEAEEQKKTGELPVLKSRVASQRDLLQSALAAALEFAHPDVLYHLGQIKPFLYLCYQFLANRFHSKDYDGKLSAVIFEVLSLCGTLTSELLEETKVIKALTSLKKHTNDKNKALIQKITESAAANSKKAKVGSPATADQAEPKSVKRSAPETALRPASDVPLLKKPRPTEGASNGAKKDAVGAAGAKTAAPATQKRPGEKPVAASAPVKTRVTQVNNKPSGLFARLTAASIQKPTNPPVGSTKSNGPVRPAATSVAAKDKKPVPQTASKPAFSFAQTMASLLKPEKTETVPVKSEKQLPNETPEEKAKRERKESRRHLRVKFRADASLVEIRYFEHEAQEDMGHEAHLKRDAGDLGGEGRMFKQHKELDVDDDEDDEDEKTWSEPSQVDFSRIDPGERSRNYFPYGGGEMQPESPEKEANIRRENATLMVIYADASDIPTSPREPLEDATPAAPAIHFGTPSSEVLQRCPAVQQPAPVMDFSNLENIMKQFANTSNQGNPATAPPAPVQAPFVPPTASNAPVDIASLLSALQQSNSQNSQPASAPAPAPPMPLPAPPALDFNAILAGLQASGAALPPPPPGAPPFPFPFPGLPQAPDNAAWQSQMQPHMQPQMQPAQDRDLNGNNKRQRDDGNGGNFDRGLGKRPKFRGSQDNKPHKVLACRFWHKGTCMKGDDCTYIHDNNM